MLVSFGVLPLLFASIHARVAAPSTNNKIEISARDSPIDPAVRDRCVIGIEIGDCDTYQTCTMSVKMVGDCSRQIEQSIHCSFDIPVGMSGEGGTQDVSAIRCFPKSRDYGRPRFPNGTDIPEETGSRQSSGIYPKNPLPPEPVDRPKCANTPLPKIPSSTCKAGDNQCTPETWYYVPPDCKPDPETPELCQPIPKSECEAAADKCDPLPLPAEEAEKNFDKCIPETWYYVPLSCSLDARIPKKCDPIPRSACNQAPDLCEPLTAIPSPPTVTEPIDHPQDTEFGPDTVDDNTKSDSDKDYGWTWSSTPDIPFPPHRGDKYPPVDFAANKLPKFPQS